MEKEQLEKIRAWFDGYVAGFYSDDDDFLNANIELKEKHSRAVCGQMRYISGELALSEQQKIIAEAIALLHDIGRFSQFEQYRTYRDASSVDHCRLGVDILREQNALAELAEQEAELISTAILYHGCKEIPAELAGDALLYCQLVRDADKIDIYRVVTEYYEQYLKNPDSFKLEIELPDEPWYSKNVLQAVINGERVDYRDLQTWNDCKLIQLSWVYDMNFIPTLKRVRQRGFLEKIIDFLPATEDIKRAGRCIIDYVDGRIKKG